MEKSEVQRPCSVDGLLDALGLIPNYGNRLRERGLTDALVRRSVLSPADLQVLFERYTYPSMDTGAAGRIRTNRVLEAFLDGLLPAEIARFPISFPVYEAALDELDPAPRFTSGLSEDERERLKGDWKLLDDTLTVMSDLGLSDTSLVLFAPIFRLVARHGRSNVFKADPRRILLRMEDGRKVGLTGAQKLKRFVEAAKVWADENHFRYEDRITSGVLYARWSGGPEVDVPYRDIAAMHRRGASNRQFFDTLVACDYDFQQAMAILRDGTAAALSAGAL